MIVSPNTFDFVINSIQDQYGEIIVSNTSDSKITVVFDVVEVDTTNNSLDTRPAKEDYVIGLPSKLEIDSQESKTVQFTLNAELLIEEPSLRLGINVAETAAPEGNNPDSYSEAKSGAAAQISQLVNIFIENPNTAEYAMDYIQVDLGKHIKILSEQNYSITVQNVGTTYIQPRGAISISPAWGIGKSTQIELNEGKGRVLEGELREFNGKYNLNTSIGLMEARVALAIGTNNEVVQSKQIFWYFPLPIITIVIGICLALILILSTKIYLNRRAAKRERSS